MRMRLDGRRLGLRQVADLLALLDLLDAAAGLDRAGYALCPVKTPRKLPPDGRLDIGLTWRHRGTGVTLRLRGVLEIAPE